MTYEESPVLSIVEPTPAPVAAADTAPSKWMALLSSRKFWAAVIGLAVLILKAYKPDIPITEDQITGVVYVLMAYILGTAIEGHGALIAGS